MKPLLFFAYLDPGSGSLVIQMVLGGVAAFLFAVKTSWRRIACFFARKRDKTDSGSKA